MPLLYDPRNKFSLPRTQTVMPGITTGEPYPKFPQPKPGYPTPQPPTPTVPSIPPMSKIELPRTAPGQTQTTKQNIKITPFMETIFGAMKNIEPTQRGAYLESLEASIKDRLGRYEFRLARGIPLSAEAQAKYGQLKASYNDIKAYMMNPEPYDAYINATASNYESSPLGRGTPRYVAGVPEEYQYTR